MAGSPRRVLKDNLWKIGPAQHMPTPASVVDRARRPVHAPDMVREVRLRFPEAVVSQLKQIAEAERCSMNAIVASFIDRCFEQDGHKRIDELAPDFHDYLIRSGKKDRR